jgi:Flp pilus assembly pilin Flp
MFGRLRSDNRGASAVAYALILPLLALLILGTIEVWRVMSVRQSLSLAVRSATHELSLNGSVWLPSSVGRWEANATGLAYATIRRELDNNDFVPQGYFLRVLVTVEPEARGPSALDVTGWLFSVRAELMTPNLVRLLPQLDTGTITFVERQVSYIDGSPGPRVPLSEGARY